MWKVANGLKQSFLPDWNLEVVSIGFKFANRIDSGASQTDQVRDRFQDTQTLSSIRFEASRVDCTGFLFVPNSK